MVGYQGLIQINPKNPSFSIKNQDNSSYKINFRIGFGFYFEMVWPPPHRQWPQPPATAAATATATATSTTTAVATDTAKEVKMGRLGEWVVPWGRTTGGGGSPPIYQNAVFLTTDFGCVTKKSCAPKNEQTIHSKMRCKKGKKSGGNRILASWQ
jgi:hypothetical protein